MSEQTPVKQQIPARETVTIEVVMTPTGATAVNVVGAGLRISESGQEWERVIQVLHAGLRAATVQAAGLLPEPSRILQAGGFVVTSNGEH